MRKAPRARCPMPRIGWIRNPAVTVMLIAQLLPVASTFAGTLYKTGRWRGGRHRRARDARLALA
jgi:hypothetical protein